MNDTIITVEGHFDYRHPAERGTVHVSAGFQGPAREEVVRLTTQRHSGLAEEAQRLRQEGAVTWWSAERLRAWSERPWNQDGKQLPLVHHAAASLKVKFADLARLAEWVERVASLDGVTLTGIEWALTEATRASITAEARHRSVQDAIERAAAYATSLGLTAVRPLAIADPGMLGDDSRPHSGATAAPMMRAMSTAQESGGLDLKPEDITVEARVHARFAATGSERERPDLSPPRPPPEPRAPRARPGPPTRGGARDRTPSRRFRHADHRTRRTEREPSRS